MDFIAKLIRVLPLEEGVSPKTNNNWKKQGWVFETINTQFPRNIKVDVFNNRIDQFNFLEQGKVYSVSVDAESREFNGRWYTDLRMFAAREVDSTALMGAMPQGMPQGGYQPQQFPQPGYQQPMGGMPQAPAAPTGDPFAAPAAPAAGDPFSTQGNNPFGGGNSDPSDDLPF